ncbi:MAG: hypothetical protein HOV68_05455 [Streptomycetaceae bacterium]|nr:hypothetical protein [Streptomycetaceae bacterium]
MHADTCAICNGSRLLYPHRDAEADAAFRELLNAKLDALEAAERADKRMTRWVWGFVLLASVGNIWLTLTNPYVGTFFAWGCALAGRLCITALRKRR